MKRQPSFSPDHRRAGFVLIVILVIVMLMSVAAYGFLVSMQTENIAARSGGDQLAAQQHARSGIEWIAALLELPAAQREEFSQSADQSSLFVVPLGDDEQTGADREPARCVIVQPLPHQPDEINELPPGLIDESSKIHLLTLLEWEKLQPESGRTALLRLPGMTGADADALLDWIDADSQPRAEGAEADVYAALPVPYQPRNGRPLDLDELLLVRGVDAFRLLGKPEPAARTGPQRSFGSHPETEQIPWNRFLTVWSAERNAARDGSPRVDVNAPQLDKLHALLAERLPADWANFIILYRQFASGPAAQQSLEAGQVTPNFALPPTRRIESLLDLVNATLAMPKDGTTAAVVSPFKGDPAALQTQLPLLLDALTTTPAERLEGRINVNLAPKEVLLAIPGIDEGLAERILGARSMAGTGAAGRNHAAWLLTEGLVDLPAMRKLLPWITAGGDVFRAEFWGIQDARSPMFRCEAIIDASRLPARPVCVRDLAPLPHELWEPLTGESELPGGRR